MLPVRKSAVFHGALLGASHVAGQSSPWGTFGNTYNQVTGSGGNTNEVIYYRYIGCYLSSTLGIEPPQDVLLESTPYPPATINPQNCAWNCWGDADYR